ncbi:MAG: hypothetical protein ACTSYX_01265 [Candidatus Thorarchaeota archaeon]
MGNPRAYNDAIDRGRADCSWNDQSIKHLLEHFIHDNSLEEKAAAYLETQIEEEMKCDHAPDWSSAKIDCAGEMSIKCANCEERGSLILDLDDIEWQDDHPLVQEGD